MKKLLFNKRTIVVVSILALFALALIINTAKTKKQTQANTGRIEENVAVAANADYYTAFRETRDSTRQREVEYLDAILAEADTDEETAKEANEQKLFIVACMESELSIEGQLKAKGFSDAAVTFHKGSVSVIVDASELTEAQTAQILDIVMRETGEPAENIKVSVRR